jgi:hypothetical protein
MPNNMLSIFSKNLCSVELWYNTVFCPWPKPGPRFQMLYVVVLLMFNGLKWEVVVIKCWTSLFKLSFHNTFHGQISGQKSDNTISSLSINRSMHDFCHIRTVIIPQPISITDIHIGLVSVWEVNFVSF